MANSTRRAAGSRGTRPRPPSRTSRRRAPAIASANGNHVVGLNVAPTIRSGLNFSRIGIFAIAGPSPQRPSPLQELIAGQPPVPSARGPRRTPLGGSYVSLATASRYSIPAPSSASAARTAFSRMAGWRVSRSSAQDSPVAVVSWPVCDQRRHQLVPQFTVGQAAPVRWWRAQHCQHVGALRQVRVGATFGDFGIDQWSASWMRSHRAPPRAAALQQAKRSPATPTDRR